MRKKLNRRRANRAKSKLGLPDLEQAKSAVLVSLRSPESQWSYRRSIDDFVSWYCSEPRLSFNKTVVTRYRIHLEKRLLAPGTINVRLAAVRRLAYEAADTGLLGPDLAAGIRRVKGAKRLGMRLGNWLTVEEARSLWQLPNMHSVKGRRDRAILAVLLGCGLRRRELIDLTLDHIQQREEHWAIVDLVGKGGHIRTIPMPDWVKQIVDAWPRNTSVASAVIGPTPGWVISSPAPQRCPACSAICSVRFSISSCILRYRACSALRRYEACGGNGKNAIFACPS